MANGLYLGRTLLNKINKMHSVRRFTMALSNYTLTSGRVTKIEEKILAVPANSKFRNDNWRRRFLSTEIKISVEEVKYEYIKDLPSHPEKLLIDVREPNELKESGKIPTSINIPLGEVESHLNMSMDGQEFRKKFGRSKPNLNTEIIFSCRSGVRSSKAANVAANLGYKTIKNYKGSWMDWAEREGLQT